MGPCAGERTVLLAPSFQEGGNKEKEVMEAHPPCLLPVGLYPSGLPACTRGGFRRTPAIPGFASMVARTIPLAPFLEGRGKIMRRWLWRHILHAACQWGYTPLDSPIAGAALLLWGAPSPWPPSFQEGGNIIAKTGGHPQTPARGRRPLDSRFQDEGHLHTSCQWGCTALDSPLAGWGDAGGSNSCYVTGTIGRNGVRATDGGPRYLR